MTDESKRMMELVERGTFACPICGHAKPHAHTPSEIQFRPDQIEWRLYKLVQQLKRTGFTFYEAMNRVYGTHYGHLAEKALALELETTCDLIAALRTKAKGGEG